MNCCNDFGQCTQGKDCPARGCSQSKGRDNVAILVKSAKKRYEPKDDTPPLGLLDDFCSFVRETWRPILLGVAIGALIVVALLLNFQPLGN